MNTTKTPIFRLQPRVSPWTLAAMVIALVLATAPAVAEDVLDGEIARAIADEYWIDDVVDANAIDVACDNGVVTLTGTVDNLLTKERAAEIAASTVGVRAIVNRLEVEPAIKRTDSELAQAVENALLEDPATDSYEIEVAANYGVITLTGTVDSWQEKELSEAVAKSVRGVVGIDNELKVVYSSERADSEIQADVESRLANDVRVDDYLITVDVTDGEVALTGTVGSLAEKNLAIADAWVTGASDVDGTGLEIEWWARDSMRRKSSYVEQTDEEIAAAVKDAFLYDPRVLSFNPEVSVTDGTVTLTGVVDNLAAKRAAEEDARNVIGVWRVRNHLKVRPVEMTADEDLEARIADAFYQDPYLERWEVDVDANLGVVYLSGKVNTSFEKTRAGMVAAGVEGVVAVVNNLAYEHRWRWKPDWEIRADIKDELWWSPYVDADEVTVTVRGGVATLTGQVDTWSELDAAEKNAYDGGAKDVRNNLTVAYRYYGPYGTFDPPMYPYGF